MKTLTAFFRLIRWRNLLIVWVTQWFSWYCVIRPLRDTTEVFLTASHLVLLTLSTLLIAAAGYIINDYFDVRIDLINKPDKVIIERVISRRAAIVWHSILNGTGLALAAILAWKLQFIWVLGLQVACTVLLWFYSTTLKRRFVTGNVAVAMLTALTILILVFYEPALMRFSGAGFFASVQGRVVVNPLGVLSVYAYFAFMLTWIREIVKDMEDFKGDLEDGCVTMPIRIGLQASGRVVIALGVCALLPLAAAALKLLTGKWIVLGLYLLIAVILPLSFILFRLPARSETGHYARLSRLLKIVMILGIISLWIYSGLQYGS